MFLNSLIIQTGWPTALIAGLELVRLHKTRRQHMVEIPDNPLIALLYWVLNTPVVGALIVAFLASCLILGYGLVLRWIANGAKANESEIYTYPTEGFHHHE